MRKGLLRRLAVAFMCMVMFCASATSVLASYDVMPCYDNTIYADASVSVSSSGVLTTSVMYEGVSSATKAVVTTCIEKQTLLFFWTDVAEWSDTIYDTSYVGSDTYQLSKEGTYRVTITFEVYGADGTVDTITTQKEVEW